MEVAPRVYAPAGAVRIQFARSSGPGGQNVNKLNTKAELWVHIDTLDGLSATARARLRSAGGRRVTNEGELHLVSESHRGQEANRLEVLDRLREMIVRAKVEPKVRKKVKISRAAKAKRLDSKKRRSEVKRNRRSSFE
jgi:ribosome-associated protein